MRFPVLPAEQFTLKSKKWSLKMPVVSLFDKEKKEKLIKEVLKRGVGAKTAFGFGRFQ